jgi:hypothetical protein
LAAIFPDPHHFVPVNKGRGFILLLPEDISQSKIIKDTYEINLKHCDVFAQSKNCGGRETAAAK